MQYKNNKQLQKSLRRAHERSTAMVVILTMLAGTVAFSHEVRRAVGEFTSVPLMAVIEHSNRESEVAHRAMRFDSVMPLNTVGGK